MLKKYKNLAILTLILSVAFFYASTFVLADDDEDEHEDRESSSSSPQVETETTTSTQVIVEKDSDGDGLMDKEDPHPDIPEIYIVKDENLNGIVDVFENLGKEQEDE